ncbi:MAG: MATE family efflux transporter [Clostridia bacterium]|nr:MATE family efflux transporter [Clostridia bacterium]MDD4048354.1 MATE family efflux transporter [Clostridia bacterium]
MESTKGNKMGTMPIAKLILTMSLPAILSMMVQAMYNIVDSIFVSRINEEALTALSLAFPVQLILISAFVGLGVGINSSVSRKLGEGDKKTATNIAEHGYLLAGILYLIVAIGGFIFVDDFFNWFTKDPVILKYCIDYTRIILVFSFGRIFAQAGMSILQGSGEMVKPMKAQLIGAISNIILDPILIFGWFGLPAMGVEGAAIATVLAQFISMLYVLLVIFRGKEYLKLDPKNFTYSNKITAGIILVGLPATIMQGLVSVMLTGLNLILACFSDASIAVVGVYFKLQSFIFMPVFGISQGTMPVIGFNYGAKNKKRIFGALKFASMIALGYLTLGMVIFLVFPKPLLMIFNSTQEMLDIGIVAFRRMCLMFPFAAITIILCTAFQGMGKAHYSMIVTFIRQIIILLPLSWYLGSTFGLDTLWYAFLIAEIIGLIMAIYFFRLTYNNVFKNWDNKIVLGGK